MLAGIFIGNALEWFDLVVFGYFAALFGRLFFPAESQIAAISLAFATFGITFLARPFGALVIGAYADRRGRKAALILSTTLMTVGTAMIASLPTYPTVGFLAPVLLVIARAIQGVSAGGEFGSATTFLSEWDKNHRGFFSSLQFSSQGFTALLATCMGVLLTRFLSLPDLDDWGWRIPFVFGVLIGPLTYVIRRYATEAADFRPTTSPLKDLAVSGKSRTGIAIAAVTLGTVVTYTIIFLPSYASTYLKFSAYDSFLCGLTTSIVLVLVTPISGAISDRLGRLPTITPAAVSLLVASYPAFAWLSSSPSFERLLTVQVGIGVFAAWYLGVLPSLMAELFPAAYRSTGLSVSYALAVTCFGGFAPLIITSLIEFTGSPQAPAFYLIFAAAISLTGLMAARRIGIH